MNAAATAVTQIDRGTILAVSGGRYLYMDDNTLTLPVRYGYSVEVEYIPGADMYEVRRMYRRGTTIRCKGHMRPLFADQLSEAVYRASCYHDPFGDCQ